MQQADRLAIVIGLGSGQFALDPAQFAITVQRVVDRTAVQRRCLLGDMGHLPGRRHLKIALVLVQLAAQQREQARLAAAIGSGQTDLPARVDLQVHIFEKHLGGAREAQLPELDHGGTERGGKGRILARLPALPPGRHLDIAAIGRHCLGLVQWYPSFRPRPLHPNGARPMRASGQSTSGFRPIRPLAVWRAS